MNPHNEIPLPGLDGGTPLGFLAGLGVLRVLDRREGGRSKDEPRLSWRLDDRWHPVVHGIEGDLETIVQHVTRDAEAWDDAPVLRFRYPKREKRGVKHVGALAAPAAVYRAWLRSRLDAGDLETLEYAAALAFEAANEPKKGGVTEKELREHGILYDDAAPVDRSTLPTAFDFTSRNAQFLEQVEEIRRTVDAGSILNTLRDGASDPRAARTLDWDPAADAPGAIYAGRLVGLRPAAEWLAFRGLAFFPVAGRGEVLRTTACRGRRKDGEFIWPLWEVPATSATIASLLRSPGIDALGTAARQERGIAQVFRSRLKKKADGYSGMFAPSEPV
ncbi:MAG: hypothetical protein IRY91_03245 [Gemmatimonadaceae bacterium]|nr:hypothetical protein [Gemmatimonadaceae bacterium]